MLDVTLQKYGNVQDFILRVYTRCRRSFHIIPQRHPLWKVTTVSHDIFPGCLSPPERPDRSDKRTTLIRKFDPSTRASTTTMSNWNSRVTAVSNGGDDVDFLWIFEGDVVHNILVFSHEISSRCKVIYSFVEGVTPPPHRRRFPAKKCAWRYQMKSGSSTTHRRACPCSFWAGLWIYSTHFSMVCRSTNLCHNLISIFILNFEEYKIMTSQINVIVGLHTSIIRVSSVTLRHNWFSRSEFGHLQLVNRIFREISPTSSVEGRRSSRIQRQPRRNIRYSMDLNLSHPSEDSPEINE